MQHEQELLATVAEGEHARLEFKQRQVSPSAVAKAISAMANHAGGLVLFGVDDHGIVCGVEEPAQLVAYLQALIAERLEPAPECQVGTIECASMQRAVVWVKTEAAASEPIAVRAEGRAGAQVYVRSGARSIPVGKKQWRLLHRGVRPEVPQYGQIHSMDKASRKIWKQIHQCRHITPNELARRANTSRRQAARLLQEWAEAGWLVMDENHKQCFRLPDRP